MESATAAVRGAAPSLARARVAFVCGGGARGPRRVVGAGLAARVRRRRALVAVVSLHEPLPSRAQEGHVPAAPQADEEEVHGDGYAAAETSSPPVVSGKTVRVRFVLEEQCALDQSVYLVGDDPALGLWDPANAIPLELAESHGWILEKDLPANKLIEFKFLLRDSSGKLNWQNGPNRIFQTGETVNTLVVYEDWGDVKNQKIAEEEGVASVGIEEAVVTDDSESRNESVQAVVLEDELQMDDDQVVNEVKEDESFVADEEDEKLAVPTNESVQVDPLKTNEANTEEPMMQKEPEIVDELHEMVNMENGSALCADENSAEKTEEDNILSEDGVPVEDGLTSNYEHDLLWGWRALQELLMSLGIKMDTT
ncbi:phosphoglucan, water dikinase, chloroplastic-like [Panicum miliaceum]|uniref:Phosphoglucan, water dikinase, chloroplastic-like n=1 Tax=Panicum miliaceum TaxID=4540 RepID=A0A3L6T5F7_PANMI|nr:phosphoglucan, water dikinase, chloroplastic-like [Panicum miliaceum]